MIAHRLSTIALADEIVVLEDGRVAAQGTHDELLECSPLYREIVEKGMPDQVFMTRKPRRGRGGGTVSRLDDIRRRLARPAAAGASSAASLELLRPIAGACRDVHVAGGRDRRRAGAGAAREARDRRRHPAPRRRRAGPDRAAFLASALLYVVASYAQTYLVGWVGQRALQDLRVKLFAHLQWLSIGFYSRNRAGVIISRLTNDVEALDQLVEDAMATLIQSA